MKKSKTQEKLNACERTLGHYWMAVNALVLDEVRWIKCGSVRVGYYDLARANGGGVILDHGYFDVVLLDDWEMTIREGELAGLSSREFLTLRAICADILQLRRDAQSKPLSTDNPA